MTSSLSDAAQSGCLETSCDVTVMNSVMCYRATNWSRSRRHWTPESTSGDGGEEEWERGGTGLRYPCAI